VALYAIGSGSYTNYVGAQPPEAIDLNLNLHRSLCVTSSARSSSSTHGLPKALFAERTGDAISVAVQSSGPVFDDVIKLGKSLNPSGYDTFWPPK